jgi:hypothetical protein
VTLALDVTVWPPGGGAVASRSSACAVWRRCSSDGATAGGASSACSARCGWMGASRAHVSSACTWWQAWPSVRLLAGVGRRDPVQGDR